MKTYSMLYAFPAEDGIMIRHVVFFLKISFIRSATERAYNLLPYNECTEKKRGAKTAPLGSRFEKMVPFWKGELFFSLTIITEKKKGAKILNMNTKEKKRLRPLKWHQNSSTKGAELRTSKQFPKGSYFSSLFFLSVMLLQSFIMNFHQNISVTSTEVDVANWIQQMESKFKFKNILQLASEDW